MHAYVYTLYVLILKSITHSWFIPGELIIESDNPLGSKRSSLETYKTKIIKRDSSFQKECQQN